jgi:hypothetical protein
MLISKNWFRDRKKKLDLKQVDKLEEVPNKGAKKKKKKTVYVSPYTSCPFCFTELEDDINAIEKAKKDAEKKGYVIFIYGSQYKKKECKCGAIEVPNCPSCNRATWYRDKIYKHQAKTYGSCGFEGERKS